MKLTLLAPILLLFGSCGAPREDPSTLIGAARAGDVPALQTMLKRGSDVNQTGGVNGWSVLQHAIHKGQAQAVDVLLENRADPNVANGGLTPLMMAAGYGYEDIVRALLRHGADAHARRAGGETALDFAVNGSSDIDLFTVGRCQTGTVKALLEAAPDMKPSESALSKAASLVRGSEGCADLSRLLQARR